MSAEENLQKTKDAYQAFASGDAEGAMSNMDDGIEWIEPGDTAISGTRRGKEELGALWGELAEKGFSNSAQHFFADGNMVVVLCENSAGGETWDSADVLTFNDEGRLVKFQTAGDTQAVARAFPS